MTWRRSGDKPLSEPMMISLLTYICSTQQEVGSILNHTCTQASRIYVMHVYTYRNNYKGIKTIHFFNNSFAFALILVPWFSNSRKLSIQLWTKNELHDHHVLSMDPNHVELLHCAICEVLFIILSDVLMLIFVTIWSWFISEIQEEIIFLWWLYL